MSAEQIVDEVSFVNWERYQPRKLTQVEVLEVFSEEAKEIVPALLSEFYQKRSTIIADIKERLTAIRVESDDETYCYIARSWLKLTLGQNLVDLKRHIARLSRLQRTIKGVPGPEGALTDDMIQAARDVPIETQLEQQFRRSGPDLICLCPLHEEKTPSFHIYRNNNRWRCYGCNQGGNSIDLAMLIHGYGFKEAVMLLAGYQR